MIHTDPPHQSQPTQKGRTRARAKARAKQRTEVPRAAATARKRAVHAAEARNALKMKPARHWSRTAGGARRRGTFKLFVFAKLQTNQKFPRLSARQTMARRRLLGEQPQTRQSSSIKVRYLLAPGERSKEKEQSWWMDFVYIWPQGL